MAASGRTRRDASRRRGAVGGGRARGEAGSRARSAAGRWRGRPAPDRPARRSRHRRSRRWRLRARSAGCPRRASPPAPGGNRGRARSAHIRRAADARCSGGARSMPASTSASSRRVSMFGAMPRLFWNSSKRVIPAKASRRIRMLHHSPTRSRLRAIGHCMSPKLLRCMADTL